MGLYIGFSMLWILGIFKTNDLKLALVTNFVFMLGLGFGSVLSLVLDGTPTFKYIFGTFAGYIFGGNDKKQAISMTSPVCMSLDNNTSTTMMFMLPKKIKTTISQNQIQRILNLKKNLQKK